MRRIAIVATLAGVVGAGYLIYQKILGNQFDDDDLLPPSYRNEPDLDDMIEEAEQASAVEGYNEYESDPEEELSKMELSPELASDLELEMEDGFSDTPLAGEE